MGPKSLVKLNQIGLSSIEDLLFHLPSYFEDHTHVTPMTAAEIGELVVMEGTLGPAQVLYRPKRRLTCSFTDKEGTITLVWFQFSRFQEQQLRHNKLVRIIGCLLPLKNSHTPSGNLTNNHLGQIIHPRLIFPSGAEQTLPKLPTELSPFYRVPDGISQNKMRSFQTQALNLCKKMQEQGVSPIQELIPTQLIHEQGYPSLLEALNTLHHPSTTDFGSETLTKARQRLSLEELVALQLSFAEQRQAIQQYTATALPISKDQQQLFRKQLSFQLTNSQNDCCTQIISDLHKTTPMLRLVQGDVGAGKTVIAAMAAFAAASNGTQVAIMAPTAILAQQHYEQFKQWFTPLGLSTTLLTGKLKAKAKREALAAVATGDSQVIIGTHALFQDAVDFHCLSLLVIDEQHRFGVEQRLKLQQKGLYPHQLMMTATPIPRTLAMTLYSELNVTELKQLPSGRLPIQTVVMAQSKRLSVFERIQQECSQGQQAYWVCPLIEESDVLNCEAAEETLACFNALKPNIKLSMVHGRMGETDKLRIMAEFKQGDIDLLIATTVIEVGVDVPNASIMVIENAERLGLSQLHQLRGRVGRGSRQSHCLLLYGEPLSKNGRKRLNTLRNESSGFAIAEEDLKLRGPGQWLGTQQTGDMQFCIADFESNQQLVPISKDIANVMEKEWPTLATKLLRRWIKNKMDYARV